jgi:indolepyruvate ferredoxin oxidoreductase, beta subunit
MSPRKKETLNLIIAGTGGQGNILISKLVGEAMVEAGYWVTIGETYGASQRGGSVASHVRISGERQLSPLIPQGAADIILGLEPVETLRILATYGRPDSRVITNVRPVHPMAVSLGEAEYPRIEDIRDAIGGLSQEALYLDASEIAIKLHAPLLANMVMAGALIGSKFLSLTQDRFQRHLELNFQADKLVLNLKAFSLGVRAVKELNRRIRNS